MERSKGVFQNRPEPRASARAALQTTSSETGPKSLSQKGAFQAPRRLKPAARHVIGIGSKRAFTILELLTVIGILGLLVSILIPSLSAARRSAKANACLSHLKNIGTGFAVYLNENDDRLPPHRLERVPPTSTDYYANGFGRRAPRWQWFIETGAGPVINPMPFKFQIDRVGFFDDESIARAGRGAGGTIMSNDTFTCPSLDDPQFVRDIRDGAFGYNYQYLGNARRDTDPDRWDNFPVALHRIRKVASTVLVADSRGAGRKHGKHSFTLDPPRLATEQNARRFGPVIGNDYRPPEEGYIPPGLESQHSDIFSYSPAEPRHNERSNVLFLDTHASAMTLKALGYQLSDGQTPQGIPKDIPIPVDDPNAGDFKVSNKLWNGMDVDVLSRGRQPPPGDGGGN